jgi:hypothetical protein
MTYTVPYLIHTHVNDDISMLNELKHVILGVIKSFRRRGKGGEKVKNEEIYEIRSNK